MAGFAALREPASDVIRILGALIIAQVTADTGRIRNVVIVIDVAVGALARRHGVLPGQ